ncbi:MAG: hypothetical protein JW929_14855, partial [Anaerolineales bacterium]|nr:hypothetical protein [Anaerolineales bacterium]
RQKHFFRVVHRIRQNLHNVYLNEKPEKQGFLLPLSMIDIERITGHFTSSPLSPVPFPLSWHKPGEGEGVKGKGGEDWVMAGC